MNELVSYTGMLIADRYGFTYPRDSVYRFLTFHNVETLAECHAAMLEFVRP